MPNPELSVALVTITGITQGTAASTRNPINKRRCVFNVFVPPAASIAVQIKVRYAGQEGK